MPADQSSAAPAGPSPQEIEEIAWTLRDAIEQPGSDKDRMIRGVRAILSALASRVASGLPPLHEAHNATVAYANELEENERDFLRLVLLACDARMRALELALAARDAKIADLQTAHERELQDLRERIAKKFEADGREPGSDFPDEYGYRKFRDDDAADVRGTELHPGADGT